MCLVDEMLQQLTIARRIVEDGNEVVPTWLITTPEGTFIVLSRFDPEKEGQREQALYLIARFMRWKLATSFVLTAVIGLKADVKPIGEEALLVVRVSFHEHRAAIQKIRRGGGFDAAEWLGPDQIDETYWRLLPTGVGEITVEEIAELSAIFGEGGELQAERLS